MQQVVGANTTRYTQDLASPLSQVLDIGTTTYVYGMERLSTQSGGTKTWYGADALGSVRQTLSNTGAVQANTLYDPWGQVQVGSVPTFGFTGEVQDGANVYLRARWYNSTLGTFLAKDPFAGFAEQPYSLNPYQSFHWQTKEQLAFNPASYHPYEYAFNNPVLLTDPTGWYPWAPSGPEGVAIHKMIQANFLTWSLTWPGYKMGDVQDEYEVDRASKFQPNKKGKVPLERFDYDNLTLLIPRKPSSGEEGYVDIADTKAYQIYEIKPKGSADLGRSELYWYMARMPGYRIGTHVYPEGTRVIGDWPTPPYNKDWEVVATIDRGVIVYQGRAKNNRIRSWVTAVCAVTVAAIAGKKLADEIINRPRRPRPDPRPDPQPQPGFDPGNMPIQPEPGFEPGGIQIQPGPGGIQLGPSWP